LMFWS